MDAAQPYRYDRAPRWKLTVESLERMVEHGIISPDDPVELLDGELYVRSPQGPVHATVSEVIAERLRLALGDRGYVREDKPLIAGLCSMPEPDVAVVGSPRSAWRRRHPRGNECLLVVEVSDSTKAIDRKKAKIYAAAGVPTYWTLDLSDRTLTVHEGPAKVGYAQVVKLAESEEVAVPGTDVRWRIGDLLE